MERAFGRICFHFALTWLLTLVLPCAAQTATQSELTLKVSERTRPVAVAVDELAHRHGWLLCYEDQIYQFSGDKEDLTAHISQSKGAQLKPETKRFIGPRRGNLRVDYRTPADPIRVLRQVVVEHANATGSLFEVRKMGNRVVVVPSKAKDKSGNLVPQTPLLDTPININEMERDSAETVEEIAKALTLASGVKVNVGVGLAIVDGTTMRFSAVNEPARDVLIRFLNNVPRGGRIVWIVYYGPNEGEYSLNFDYIAPKSEMPSTTSVSPRE